MSFVLDTDIQRRYIFRRSHKLRRAGKLFSRYAGEPMPRSVLVEMDLPRDWRMFRLPPALQDRLQELLDRQDREGKITPRERREATALTELVDMLALLKARAELSAKRKQP